MSLSKKIIVGPKQPKFGIIDEEIVCPVRTVWCFAECTKERRTHLPSNHTLFLTYIEDEDFSKISSVKDKTVAQWTTNSLTAAGIDPDKFTAHLIRAAASIYAVQQGASIREVKIHANWSLNADTFEKYYLRPANRRQQGQMISKRVLEESHTAIVEGTTHNSLVGETETEDMVGACPWY
ncbi:hypothetical protein G6F70_005029 [Rhizopus microsporus]|uniref:Tyr recombinase domain-containing protein n=1 Tax=Rhizopus microsporus TaxID=58291 RepID=A0A1X0RX35_RHIZD|nr:hypothetical protein G6F71_004604 [Rhizopus microsporus]KAG1199326.1 hypothetical protein G6F70_005029 [Rhizopus microsporus]KAG1211140.1 hypothetical protein G6F69_004856 [Rhizopus microsporus]KAG1228071.1 hypothetical protein G6F67_008055 [Rhizopus microsporus]KAG1260020.1 hypothetical protein G6F68_007724 [Rhizopus microsporus]